MPDWRIKVPEPLMKDLQEYAAEGDQEMREVFQESLKIGLTLLHHVRAGGGVYITEKDGEMKELILH